MGTQEKASFEVWATRLVSAASILALAYFALFVDFTSHGRIWDKLAARVPALAKLVPPQAGLQATVVTKGGAGLDNVPITDRTLIVSEQAQARPSQAQAAAPAATVARAPAQAAAKQAPTPHLTSSLTPYDITDNSKNTIISVPAQAAKAGQQTVQAAAAPSAAAQSQSAAAPVIAAKASYGAASRSEMMGQAAGPVYNLTGKK